MNATDQTTPPLGSGEPPRRLTRSDSDKVLTGLAGGLGRHFGVDPVIFRIAFVVLSFVGGTGVLAYLAGWLLIPDESGASEADRMLKPKNRKVALWLLAIIGVGMFFDGFDNEFGGFPFGLLLIGIGFAVLWSRRDSGGGGAGGGGGGESEPGGRAAPHPEGTRVSLAKAESFPTTEEEAAPHAPPPPSRPPKPRSVLVPVTISLLAILGGAMALAGVSPQSGVAIALLVTGVALVVGAWRGRARVLIPVAIVLTIGLGAAAIVDVPLRGGAGERNFRPDSVVDVRTPYRLAFGQMTLDLTSLVPAPATSIVASVGLGQLTVIVPARAEVVVRAHAGLGELDIVGQRSEGADVNRRLVLAGAEGGGRIVLTAEVGMGQVEVRRAAA